MLAAVTILLALSVYQIIVSDKLPSSFTTLPVIGQWITLEAYHKIRILQCSVTKVLFFHQY